MSDGFTAYTFGELIEAGVLQVGDGYRAKNEELGGNGPIFLRAGHVTDTHVDFSGVERFTPEATPKVANKMSRPGDVVVTTKGNSTGRVTYVSERYPDFVYSPHLSFWRSLDLNRLVPGFLRYWSRGQDFREQLAGLAGSTDMAPYLSLVDQRRLRIRLPPPKDQRAIAHILGSLDDKIDLNRRMNETLEALARAIFKSWFVDFDPVRAKMEGRDPVGMDAETAALFPDRLQESEIGEIPAGWPVATWGKLATLEYGKSLRDYDNGHGAYAVYGTNGRIGSHSEALCKHPGIIIGRKGAYRGVHFSSGPFFVIDTAFYVEPKEPIDMRWAYYTLLLLDINSMDSGSAIPSTSRDDFYGLPVANAPEPVQRAFGQSLHSYWTLQEHNNRESTTLSQLRDTLLPKLLSGELRIPDAEKVAEAAL